MDNPNNKTPMLDNNLKVIHQRITNVHQRLGLIESLLRGQKKTLNMEEASLYTGLSKSHLYKLTSAGEIPHSKPRGKLIYFSREELDQWMLRNKVATTADLSVRAATHALTKPARR